MLHTATTLIKIDVVKLLLEHGADPASRNINGQTAYVKLLTWTLAQDTAPILPIQGLMALVTKKQFSPVGAYQLLALFEDIGGDACALEDEYYTKEKVEEIHSNLKTTPRLSKIYNPIQIANTSFQISRYFHSNSPRVSNLTSDNGRQLLIKLARSLATWTANRKEGLIAPDSLPDDGQSSSTKLIGRWKALRVG